MSETSTLRGVLNDVNIPVRPRQMDQTWILKEAQFNVKQLIAFPKCDITDFYEITQFEFMCWTNA